MKEDFLTPVLAKDLLETYRAFEAHPDDIAIASLSKEQFFEFLRELGIYFFDEDDIEKIVAALEKIASQETTITEDQAVVPQNLRELVVSYEKWLEDRENYKKTPSEAFKVNQEIDAARFTASLRQYKEQKQTEKIIENIPPRRVFPLTSPSRPPETPPSQPLKPPAPPSILYLYYRPATWTTLVFNNFSVLFGKESKTNKVVLEQALERFLQENKTATQNLPFVQALRLQIETGRLIEERLERAYFDSGQTPETQEGLKKQGFDLLQLAFNTSNQRIEATTPSTPLPAGRQAPSPPSSAPSQIRSSITKQGTSVLKNLASKAAIALRQLFVNPNLGWLRTLLSVSSISGAIFFPVAAPFKIALGGFGGSLAVAQGGHSSGFLGNLASNIGMRMTQGLGKIAGQMALRAATAWGAPLLVAIVAIIGGIVLLGWFNINSSQGIFLKEGVIGLEENYESEFIGLEKTVNPTSSGTTPVTANFTITITAKKNNLTNIVVKDHFSVYSSKGNPSPPSVTLPTIKDSLGVGETDTISFSVELGQEFQDSIVTNTVEVTADIENGPQGEKVTRSASIQIGETPTSCFVFNDSWPEGNRNLVMQAIGHMSQAGSFMGKLCGGNGTVNLRRSFSNPGWSGEVINTNTIIFYNNSFTSSEQMMYVLAHETGHVFAWRNTNIFREFLQAVNPGSPGREGYIPTYPARLGDQLSKPERQSEDFAETIGIYIVWRVAGYVGNYNLSVIRDTYTEHWSFAKNNIFDGFEF